MKEPTPSIRRRRPALVAAGMLAALGILGAHAASAADSGVAYAKERLAALSTPTNTWDGPTSGPALAKGKHVVILSCCEAVDVIHAWGEGVKKAAGEVGWKVTVIDGRNSPQGWREGMTQAIALNPDAIVHNALDVNGLQDLMAQAEVKGIKQVAIHGTSTPGPHPDLHLFYNVQQDPEAIGAAQADFIIAHSNGTAKVVLVTHGEYAITHLKIKGVKDELAKCPGCKVLEVSDYPFAEAAQRAGQNAVGWVQKYGTPLYINSTSDVDGTYMVPGLRTAGVNPKDAIISTADGQKDAYVRIASGDQYWTAVVAEPLEAEGYHVVDELNRAFNNQPPSGYVEKPYVVTRDNMDKAGGPKSMYIPENDYAKNYRKVWGLSQ